MSATKFSYNAPADAAGAAELRRVKALATLVLAGTLALFVTAKMLLPLHPVFGFVAAFAEAATIGGLADWYAVVALFRRPLGLTRRIHRGAFSRSSTRGSQAAADRFRLVHCRLAARPQAQHRSRPLHASAVARSIQCDRNIGPDGVHYPSHQHPVAVDRSRPARGRYAARVRAGGPSS